MNKLLAINQSLAELGYLSVAEHQLRALRDAVEDYDGKLADCVRLGRTSDHWEVLRCAQFGASEVCSKVLGYLGITATLPDRIRTLVTHGTKLRSELAEVLRRGTAATSPSPLESIRRAFDSRHDPTGQALAAKLAESVCKVYGAKYALTFEATRTPGGKPALQIEAAQRIDGSRAFDWERKIAVQLVDHELVELLAVLRGQCQCATFGYHGKSRDKFVDVGRQGDFIHTVVRQGTVARAVPIPKSHTFRLMSLVIAVLGAANPGLTPDLIMALATQASPSQT